MDKKNYFIAFKIFKFLDLRLVFYILKTAQQIESAYKSSSLLKFLNTKINKILPEKYGTETLYSYIIFCLRIRQFIGCKDTCLTRSILLCRVLRESGINAKVNFGTKKKDRISKDNWSTVGHCWVIVNDDKKNYGYPFIVQYPEGNVC